MPYYAQYLPINTAIMLQFIYNFIIFNDYISIAILQTVVLTFTYYDRM